MSKRYFIVNLSGREYEVSKWQWWFEWSILPALVVFTLGFMVACAWALWSAR